MFILITFMKIIFMNLKIKFVILFFSMSFSIALNAQVGIGTVTPGSTLDVTAKLPTGTDASVDGLLIPRVTRQRAQSMQTVPTSTLIYVNQVTSGTQTGTAINIDAVGYYYFDTVWMKLIASSNIYNTSGILTNNRVVTQNANTLAFNATAVNAFSVDGPTLSVDASNDRVGIGTAAPTNKVHIVGTTDPLRIQGLQAGAAADNILTVDATGVVKQTPSGGVKGLLTNTYTAVGTTALTINSGTTAAIPGVTLTFTPTVNTTAIITVSSLATSDTPGVDIQGSIDVMQKIGTAVATKLSSQYYSGTDGELLGRLGNYTTTTRQVNLNANVVYVFTVQAKSWTGNSRFNFNPFPAYSGSLATDADSMKTIMNISLYTR